MSADTFIDANNVDLKNRQATKFDPVIERANQINEGEAFGWKGRNRFDAQQIKRHLRRRLPGKRFNVVGRTEFDGHFWVYVQRLVTQKFANYDH